MLFSPKIFASEAVKILKTDPVFEGLVIKYCTLNNKVCSTIDRSHPDFLLSKVIERMPAVMAKLESLEGNFESLKMAYKIADIPGQESKAVFSYNRPKNSK